MSPHLWPWSLALPRNGLYVAIWVIFLPFRTGCTVSCLCPAIAGPSGETACWPAPAQIQHMRHSLRVLGLRNPLRLFLGPHKPHALLSTGGDCCSHCHHAVISDGFLWLAAVLNWPCSQLTPLDSHQALLRERSYFSLLYFFFSFTFPAAVSQLK